MPQTLGRCPHCGKSVTVNIIEGQPGEILPHACGSRACEYEGCQARALMEEMVQFNSEEWYCPHHALLLAAKDLVSLYRAEGDADWTVISEIIGETLPDLVTKAETQEHRRP